MILGQIKCNCEPENSQI